MARPMEPSPIHPTERAWLPDVWLVSVLSIVSLYCKIEMVV